MTFPQNLDRVASSAVCGFLANGGNAALATFVVQGLLVPGGQVPAAAAGLGLLALNAGCSFNPEAGGPPPGSIEWTGCRKLSSGTMSFWPIRKAGSNVSLEPIHDIREITAITTYTDASYRLRYRIFYKNINWTDSTASSNYVQDCPTFELRLSTGAVCAEENVPGAPATIAPVTINDTECNITVEHLAWYQNLDGTVQPVLKMSSASQTRASGGIISGCNFNPVIYVPPGGGGGGGGGGGIIPWVPGPDGPDGPWWLDAIKSVADDAAVAIGRALLEKLFETRTQPVTYRLRSVCEVDADGEAINTAVEVPIPSKDLLNSLVDRVDALTVLLQAHKDYKQPICRGSKPTGPIVTVNFESEENSAAGTSPLRKTLSYRNNAGATLAEETDHWKDFTWKAGPVIVSHEGSSMGALQVWAESEAEGKRVIAHAGAIAGVDPTKDGGWIVRKSNKARYGQPGNMRTSTKGGLIQVSSRQGPSGPPVKAVA